MIVYIIIAVTVLISMAAFNNHDLFYRFRHWPYQESRRGEYYRWISSGFLHADPMHLIFNMIALYGFGGLVLDGFSDIFPEIGPGFFVFFYLVSMAAASSATFFKYRNTSSFASIGASGAVSAVVFAAILMHPSLGMYLFFIPIPIPGFIFGPLYLWYSSYASNRSNDNIDHVAHFYGAVFGFVFPLLFQPGLILHFFQEMTAYVHYLLS